MAPAKKAAAKAASTEEVLLPRIGSNETNRLAPVFDLAAVKALLAGDAKASNEPFADPDFDGGPPPLPAALQAAMSAWKRAGEVVDGQPYVLEPTVDPASPRTLANGLRVPLDQPADAVPLLEWVASCLLLISERAGSVRKGDYLWELIHPQTDAGVPLLSHRGRYVVRLYDHGCWRAVTVDDTLPCGAAGGCVLPCTLAPLELWPLLLTKALLKLGARTAAGLQPRDPGVLTALTGWLPQAIPIAPASQPAHLIWLAITRALGAAGTIVAVAADVPGGDEARAAELAAIGVRPGPLVGVLEARSAAGDNYVRLTSELVRWRGRLHDRDEAAWTAAPELDGALDWKRRQRLRKVAAGATFADFWTDEASLCAAFGELLVWRDPAVPDWLGAAARPTDGAPAARPAMAHRVFSGLSYVPGHSEALLHIGGGEEGAAAGAAPPSAPPAEGALSEEASGVQVGPPLTPVLLALAVSPAASREEAPCWLRVQLFRPDEPEADGALLHLDATRLASTTLALAPGAYRLSVHSATELSEDSAVAPTFFHFTLHACAAAPSLELGELRAVCAAQLGRRCARLDGERAHYAAVEAGAWAVLIRARLTLKALPPAGGAPAAGADAAGTVPIVVELLPHDERAAERARLHLIDNESGAELSPALLRGAMRGRPGGAAGYTILVDALPAASLERGGYTLDVRAPADAELALESVLPAVHASGRYEASYAHTQAGRFVLFRYVATGAAKSHAAVRIAVSDAGAELTVSVYRAEKAAAGEKGGAAPPPAAEALLKRVEAVGSCTLAAVPLELADSAKGATGARVIVEVTVSRQTIERLGLLRQPRAPPPDPLNALEPPPRPLLALEAGAEPEPSGAAADSANGASGEEARGGLTYELSALSDVAVTLTVDDERARRLEAVKAAWEAKEAGRRARGQASRVAFLVRTGALSEDEGAALMEAAGGGGAGKGAGKAGAKGAAKPPAPAKGEPKGSRRGSMAGRAGAEPAGEGEDRALLWRAPTVIRPAGPHDASVLDAEMRERELALLSARVREAEAQREALAEARAAHAGPREELVASLAQSHADWRSEVAQMVEEAEESWDALRAERNPAGDDVSVAGKSAKGSKTKAGGLAAPGAIKPSASRAGGLAPPGAVKSSASRAGGLGAPGAVKPSASTASSKKAK